VEVKTIDRVRLAQAVLVLVLVASIVIQDRVDGAAQTAMLVVGAASCVGLVATLAMRRASPFPSQNARREPVEPNRPQPGNPVAGHPAPPSTSSAQKRKSRKR
jgi:hypothetical protein